MLSSFFRTEHRLNYLQCASHSWSTAVETVVQDTSRLDHMTPKVSYNLEIYYPDSIHINAPFPCIKVFLLTSWHKLPVCLSTWGKYKSVTCRTVPILFGMWGISPLNFHFADEGWVNLLFWTGLSPLSFSSMEKEYEKKNDCAQTFIWKWYE